MNRAIWDDPNTTNKTKIECLKWSNELAHQLWNLLFELKQMEDNEFEIRLADNINFYRKQSEELGGHLAAIVLSTIKMFKRTSQKSE